MWTRLKTFFTPPVFEGDEIKTWRARVISLLVFNTTLALVVGGGVGILLFFTEKKVTSIVMVIALSASFICYLILKRGHVRTASLVVSFVYWMCINGMVFVSGGIHSLDILFYISAVVAAGLMLGISGGIFFALLSLATALVYVLMELNGFIFPTLFAFQPIAVWINLALGLAFALIPSSIAFHALTQALTRANRELAQRRRVEAELRLSEERYRQVSSVISDYTFSSKVLADGSLELEWIAGAFEAITGYTLDEFKEIGGWAATLHPEHRQQDAQDMQMLHNNQRVVTEVRILRKDGAERWVRVYAHPVTDEGRNLVGIYGAVQDITERKAAEEANEDLNAELRLLYEKVRSSEINYRMLFEEAPIGIFITDENDIIRMVNPGACQMLGCSEEEMIGKSPSDFAGPKDLLRLKYIGVGDLASDETIRHERVLLRKDGSPLFIYTNSKALPDGRIQHLAADLSDRVRAEQAIHQLNEALEQRVQERTAQLAAANRELEAFSYTVSHDLRTPLRAIQSFSQIVMEDYALQLGEEGRSHLERVIQATRKMNTMIDSLLAFARLARVELQRAPVDLSALAAEIVEELKAAEPEHSPACQVAPGLVAHADPGLMRIVLENLLGNAWKYSARNPQAAIEFQAENREGRHVFFVRDNGVGFDMEHARQLFDPFRRLHRADEFPGHGIGLATVQRILQRHGGEIWAEAGVDQGATFYFTLEEDPKGFKNL